MDEQLFLLTQRYNQCSLIPEQMSPMSWFLWYIKTLLSVSRTNNSNKSVFFLVNQKYNAQPVWFNSRMYDSIDLVLFNKSNTS